MIGLHKNNSWHTYNTLNITVDDNTLVDALFTWWIEKLNFTEHSWIYRKHAQVFNYRRLYLKSFIVHSTNPCPAKTTHTCKNITSRVCFSEFRGTLRTDEELFGYEVLYARAKSSGRTSFIAHAFTKRTCSVIVHNNNNKKISCRLIIFCFGLQPANSLVLFFSHIFFLFFPLFSSFKLTFRKLSWIFVQFSFVSCKLGLKYSCSQS